MALNTEFSAESLFSMWQYKSVEGNVEKIASIFGKQKSVFFYITLFQLLRQKILKT